MERFPIEVEGLKRFIKTLGLKWRVKYSLAPEAKTCQIVSDPFKKIHEVILTQLAAEHLDYFLRDLVHELCHAKLCEAIDISFATLYFSDRSNQLYQTDPERFTRLYGQMAMAWAHVDIWVDDVIIKHWPSLKKQSDENWIADFMTMINRPNQPINSMEVMLSLAMQQAEIYRHKHLAIDLFKVLEERGVIIEQSLKTLATFYQTLPNLTGEKNKDLKILETSVKQAAHLLNFEIKPRLIKEKNRWVWDISS
jgi:hypothetical protein